ncbi:MAG: hypothetical protein ACI97A_002659 [Planctomycetota bacterium]|jgi:hypothetical protein
MEQSELQLSFETTAEDMDLAFKHFIESKKTKQMTLRNSRRISYLVFIVLYMGKQIMSHGGKRVQLLGS